MKKADFLQNFKLLKHWQDCRCIYFLFKDEELVYVGITDNIDLRVKHHKHLKKGNWDRCYYMSLPFDTNAELAAVKSQMTLDYNQELWN